MARVSEKVRYCGCKSTASKISFGIMCLWRWPSHRHPVQLVYHVQLFQATFLSIGRLREISDLQHSFRVRHRFSEKRHSMSVISSRFTFQALPPHDSVDFNFFNWLDGCQCRVRCLHGQLRVQLQVQPVLYVVLKCAEVRRSLVPKHIALFGFIDLSRDPLQYSSKSLVRYCKDSSHTEGRIVKLGRVSRVLCQCLESTTLSHLILSSSTQRWRRIRRICPRCPQLLDHHLSHYDLFLLSFSVSLQGRHPCCRSRDPVDELLVLLLCQTHSCLGCDENSSSRSFQRPVSSAPTLK